MGAHLRMKCPHCYIGEVAMLIVASVPAKERSYRHAFLQCPDCLKPSCATLYCHSDSEAPWVEEKTVSGVVDGSRAFHSEGSPLNSGWRLKQSWPEQAAAVIPAHLPPTVHKAFAGAEATFRTRGLEEQAAAGYGRALDIGTKLIAAQEPDAPRYEKKMVAQRLDMLADAHRIPPDLRDWGRQIQAIRNPAMHDVQDMPRSELETLRGLTEMVLRYLFTLPTMVSERKEATKAGLVPLMGSQDQTTVPDN